MFRLLITHFQACFVNWVTICYAHIGIPSCLHSWRYIKIKPFVSNTLVLPTFLYGSENLNLTALQRRGIEAAEMKLLRPLAGYTIYDHKTNDYIRHEPRITGILDKKDEYRRDWLSHLQRMSQNRIPLKSYHYRPQGRRTVGRPKKRWREQL